MPEENNPTENTSNLPIEVIASKELKVLLTWKAPSRAFKPRNKEFWTTVLSIVFLVGLILFFVHEWFLIAAIISLTFVYYVLSTVQPDDIEYSLTNRGVTFAGQVYPWENFYRFWFSDKYGQRMVNLDMRSGLVGRLSLMVGKADEKAIKEVLLKYLIEETADPTFMENAADWLQKKVPLEGEKERTPFVPSETNKK